MKELYVAIKMFWKYKWLNFLVIVTMVSSILYLLPLLEQQVHYSESIEVLKDLDMENAYYLYANPFYSRKNPKLSESVQVQIENVGYVTGSAEIFYLSDEKHKYSISIYNDILIQKFCPELKEGVWLNESVEMEEIPVVVTEDTGVNCGEVFEIVASCDEAKQSFLCKAIGVIRADREILTFLRSADEKYFTTDALLEVSPYTVIMPQTETLEQFILDEKYLIRAGGRIIYTADGTLENEVAEDFGYAGSLTNLRKGSERFYQQTKSNIIALGGYFVMYLLITIVCLLCNTIILMLRFQKVYTIYFLNGMSMKSYLKIELIRMVVLIIFCVLISFGIIVQMGYFDTLFQKIPVVFLVLGMILYSGILFLPAIWFLWRRNKKEDFLKQIQGLKIE